MPFGGTIAAAVIGGGISAIGASKAAGAQSAAAGGPSFAGGGSGGMGGGGGGPVQFTVVVNAAGDVIDDGTYRRLGRVVTEAARRGYVKKAA